MLHLPSQHFCMEQTGHACADDAVCLSASARVGLLLIGISSLDTTFMPLLHDITCHLIVSTACCNTALPDPSRGVPHCHNPAHDCRMWRGIPSMSTCLAAWEMTSSSSSGTPDSQVCLSPAGGPEHTFTPTLEVLVDRPCADWHGHVLVWNGHVLIETVMCFLRW